MYSWRRLLPLFLLALAARGQNSFSLEKEAVLGAQMAAELRKQAVPVKSEAIQAFAGSTARRLAPFFGSPFPWTVEVVTGLPPDPVYEPVSVPGGYVFIPAGLLLNARTEGEFAGVLAHAMAHVAHRDGTRAASYGLLSQPGRIPLIFIGGWGGGWARGPLAKTLERDADASAVTVLRQAGYDSEGLVDFIARVQPANQTEMSSLPDRDTRVAALQRLIGELAPPKPDAEFRALQDEMRALAPPEAPRSLSEK